MNSGLWGTAEARLYLQQGGAKQRKVTEEGALSWPGAGRRMRRAEVRPSFRCGNSSLLQAGEEGYEEWPPCLHQGLPGMSFQSFLSHCLCSLCGNLRFSLHLCLSLSCPLFLVFFLYSSSCPLLPSFFRHFLEEQLGDLGKGNAMGPDCWYLGLKPSSGAWG